jgi:23S rRNA pseudouridine1911/1915/1917 synthase
MSEIYHLLEVESPRLDRFLCGLHPEIPRSRWDAWIREGRVLVNGQPVTKSGTKVRKGELVETDLPEAKPPAADLSPEEIDLPSLFEDERIWIVDKPAGMVVHPGPGHPNGTIVNALLGRIRADWAVAAPDAEADPEDDEEAPAKPWPGLVHRLDRYTTGCLALARLAPSRSATWPSLAIAAACPNWAACWWMSPSPAIGWIA